MSKAYRRSGFGGPYELEVRFDRAGARLRLASEGSLRVSEVRAKQIERMAAGVLRFLRFCGTPKCSWIERARVSGSSSGVERPIDTRAILLIALCI